jgi:hypothetical protein
MLVIFAFTVCKNPASAFMMDKDPILGQECGPDFLHTGQP